jgi:hypothetical protein
MPSNILKIYFFSIVVANKTNIRTSNRSPRPEEYKSSMLGFSKPIVKIIPLTKNITNATLTIKTLLFFVRWYATIETINKINAKIMIHARRALTHISTQPTSKFMRYNMYYILILYSNIKISED